MASFFKTPKPAPLPAPAPMPVPDDELIKQKKKREMAARMESSGRSSTILTDSGGSDTLG